MTTNDQSESAALPPTPECEPYVYCPFTNNGAYHGVCLWHEGAERTCTCNGATDHDPSSTSAAPRLTLDDIEEDLYVLGVCTDNPPLDDDEVSDEPYA